MTDPRTGKLIRGSTHKEVDAAINWRVQKLAALARGERHREDRTTVARAGEELLAGMRAGTVLKRDGERYKPATLRGCEQALRDYIVPTLRSTRLTDLERREVQDVVESMIVDGFGASTIRNALLPCG